MYYVRIIDSNGIFVDETFIDKLTEFTIEAPIPNGMYAVMGITPKWDGAQWVEIVSAPIVEVVVEKSTDQRISELETLVLQMGGII